MFSLTKAAVVGLSVSGLLAPMAVTEASAATARHIYSKGHSGYAYRGYGGRAYGYRHYGRRSNVGPVVAGAALGLIGAAAGAAIASRGYDDDYGYGGYGGGYPYGGPGYAYGGYGPAPYSYGGYGYGYQPF